MKNIDLEKLISETHNRANGLGSIVIIIIGISIYLQFKSESYFIIANGLMIAFAYFFFIQSMENQRFMRNIGNEYTDKEKNELLINNKLPLPIKQSKNTYIFFLIFICGVYLLSYKIKQWDYEEKLQTETMNSNAGYTTARIIGIEHIYNRNKDSKIYYEFIINRTRYKDKIITGYANSWVNTFSVEKDDIYRIQYEKGNIKNHKLLVFEPLGQTRNKLIKQTLENLKDSEINQNRKKELIDTLESRFGFIGICALNGRNHNLSGERKKPIKTITKDKSFIKLIRSFEIK